MKFDFRKILAGFFINFLHNFVFLLAGHKVDFIAPCGANKSTFCPASRKKIVCNMGKTFILVVWLLPSLCSGIKLHTRKINFFSLVAQCTIMAGKFAGKNVRSGVNGLNLCTPTREYYNLMIWI